MARIDWVKSRLDNWARWKVEGRSRGLGYATQSSFLNSPPSSSYYDRDVRIPIDEIEASITDEAVEHLRSPRPRLYEALQYMYPAGVGVLETARRMGCQRANVYALLNVADQVLAQWFNERAQQQRKTREAREKSFTP